MPHSDQWDVPMLARILRRRLLSIVLLAVIAASAAIGFSSLQKPEYTATSGVLFREQSPDQALIGNSTPSGSVDPTVQASTNMALVSLPVIAEQTGQQLKPPLSRSQVAREVSTSTASQSDVVNVAVTDRSPQRAAEIANTYAAVVVQAQRNIDRDAVSAASTQVHAQLESLSAAGQAGAQGSALRARLQQLAVLGSLQTGDAEVVQAALVPTSPSSPRLVRNAGLGLLIGLVLGIALAFVREGFDRRVKTSRASKSCSARRPSSRFRTCRMRTRPLRVSAP